MLLLGILLHAQEHTFEFISNHIYLNAEVNGKPARLVFDTGSSDVYLDSTWLSESGIKNARMGKAMVRGAGNEAKKTTLIFSGVNVSMNGSQYSPQMVPVIDLRAILGDTADGIFGLKNLKEKIIVIGINSRSFSNRSIRRMRSKGGAGGTGTSSFRGRFRGGFREYRKSGD